MGLRVHSKKIKIKLVAGICVTLLGVKGTSPIEMGQFGFADFQLAVSPGPTPKTPNNADPDPNPPGP